MIRIALAVVMLASCLRSHDASQREVGGDECASCHLEDYQSTSAPPHAASAFPTTCVNCHRQTSWQPALDGLHPEPRFPIASSAHRGIGCITCHDLEAGASRAGANTNCIQCHPDDARQRSSHQGAQGPAGQPYAYSTAQRNFCLTCHPDGRARNHPDDRFPRTGDHQAACTTCHDRASGPDTGGRNTTCLGSGCHSIGRMDDKHDDVSRYPAERGDASNRHFCLACHPSGQK
ncbi:MAG: hypothetical protein ACTHU0_20430 [Kofleriaceae bacterium]